MNSIPDEKQIIMDCSLNSFYYMDTVGHLTNDHSMAVTGTIYRETQNKTYQSINDYMSDIEHLDDPREGTI